MAALHESNGLFNCDYAGLRWQPSRRDVVHVGHAEKFEPPDPHWAMGNDADRVNVFFVSVDPDRDTTASMKDYLSSFDPHLKGLTGSSEEISKITSEYRVYSRKVPLKGDDYTIDHTSLVYLIDSEGKFAKPFDLKRSAQASAVDLERYL